MKKTFLLLAVFFLVMIVCTVNAQRGYGRRNYYNNNAYQQPVRVPVNNYDYQQPVRVVTVNSLGGNNYQETVYGQRPVVRVRTSSYGYNDCDRQITTRPVVVYRQPVACRTYGDTYYSRQPERVIVGYQNQVINGVLYYNVPIYNY